MRFTALLLTTVYAISVKEMQDDGEWTGQGEPVPLEDWCDDVNDISTCDSYGYYEALCEFYEENLPDMFPEEGKCWADMKKMLDEAMA